MSKDILGEYDNNSFPSGASNGGQVPCRDVNNYQPPKGPSNIGDPKTPGLHGTNHGNNGTQGRH